MRPSHLFLPTAATLVGNAAANPAPQAVGDLAHVSSPAGRLLMRQMDANSVCSTYGIDFADGGSYFINTNSNASFSFVSEFSGCNNDTASLMLVNDDTSDQIDCTSVATVPDNADMTSTCSILKNAIVNGNYSIIALGNNGNGNPLAAQRNFQVSAGPQQTITVTPTVTFTVTSTPTTTTTSTSIVNTTSTVPSNSTVTGPPGTAYSTITPAAATTRSTQTITRTFRSWTNSLEIDTETVAASCTVPPRPSYPDGPCKITPTLKPSPAKRSMPQRSVESGEKRLQVVQAAHARLEAKHSDEQQADKRNIRLTKRDPDAPTLTSTASPPVQTTTTETAPASTVQDVVTSTSTIYTTSPPKTVVNGATVTSTVTASGSTLTQVTSVYSRIYVTSTINLTWTYSRTTTPAAAATDCKKHGGHFGTGWTS